MAKIIEKQNNKCEVFLKRISWKETAQIYCNSVLIMFYIGVINLFKLIKFYFHTRVKQTMMKQFWMLGNGNCFSESREGVKKNKNNGSSISPLTLTPTLGQHKFIRIKKTRFHYVEKGEHNQETILLLHGFPDCWFGWRHQIGVLSQNNRVIALDLKGFNESEKPAMRHHYKPETICTELARFLDAINLKPVSIVGHDVGALVGWIFAYKYPEYVKKFISISTPHPNLYWSSNAIAWLSTWRFKMLQIPFLPENELNRDHKFIREVYTHLMDEIPNEINHEKFTRENLMETYEYIFGRSSDWSGALNYFRNFMFYRIESSHSLKCPCLLIFGTSQSNFKLDSAIKSTEFCENPLIKIIDGAGYFAHQTNPHELNAILLKYLGSENSNDNAQHSDDEAGKSLIKRVMNKVYAGQKWMSYS